MQLQSVDLFVLLQGSKYMPEDAIRWHNKDHSTVPLVIKANTTCLPLAQDPGLSLDSPDYYVHQPKLWNNKCQLTEWTSRITGNVLIHIPNVGSGQALVYSIVLLHSVYLCVYMHLQGLTMHHKNLGVATSEEKLAVRPFHLLQSCNWLFMLETFIS